MHPTVLATRNGAAQARIKAAAKELSEVLDLPAELAALNSASYHDPLVAILFEREAVATLLEAAVEKFSAPDDASDGDAVTDEKPVVIVPRKKKTARAKK